LPPVAGRPGSLAPLIEQRDSFKQLVGINTDDGRARKGESPTNDCDCFRCRLFSELDPSVPFIGFRPCRRPLNLGGIFSRSFGSVALRPALEIALLVARGGKLVPEYITGQAVTTPMGGIVAMGCSSRKSSTMSARKRVTSRLYGIARTAATCRRPKSPFWDSFHNVPVSGDAMRAPD
jgi:hypothetical protein